MAAPNKDGLQERAALVPLVVADVYQLAGQLRRDAERLARRIGQTQARWQVLSAASAEPATVAQIARRLGIARQNVQRVADLLLEERLARLEPNPHHKSSPFVVLTEAGRAALDKLTANAKAWHRELARELSPAELAGARRVLRRLCTVLERRDGDAE